MPFGKPITFEDQERIEIERERNRKKIMKRNSIIIYAIGGTTICLVAFLLAQVIGAL